MGMKKLICLFAAGCVVLMQAGCSANASVGNHHQHGAGVSAKTKGSDKGVHASVY
jgi:hypothetical protein